MKKINVLIVDDSAFMRRMLSDILKRDHRIEVAGTARNGMDALNLARKLQPDVITMDIEMPKMDGLKALESIMLQNPLPVIMLSSLTKEGADATIKAMALGAVDFIEKPSGPISLDIDNISQSIVQKVLTASKAKVEESHRESRKSAIRSVSLKNSEKQIIAIGTSTGGPRALDRVLRELPSDLPPIVIVQHMPKGFTHSLAKRLNTVSSIHVKEGEHGEPLMNGTAYIAPGGLHMTVANVNGKPIIELDEEEPVFNHRPSVNKLFSSLVNVPHVHITTIIMTGMGADGTEGLIKLKSAFPDTYTIAESSESCVVFGMPKAVIKSGLADEIVPISMISRSLMKALGV